jgi:diaminohydroxyphosphoribosylaminopyrimidine deaminase / 5-amino-6-(5-phosphoribosylamino)uracil reductase
LEPDTRAPGFDELMMRRALELAARGAGQVSPGPLVGCVVVSPGGEIVGEGFYLYEQLKHAETIALEQAGEQARGATAYVSLEPHAHHGRTPPCTEALIRAGVARVLAPIEDPNPVVSGRGFTALRAAGLEVETGLLSREAARQNEAYIHSIRTARPFVHLKLASSLDGKIATRAHDSRWITGPESRARVHELRHQSDAILVGAGTVTADDPLLTDRSNRTRRKPLVRVVLDEKLCLQPGSQLAQTGREFPTLVFTAASPDGGAARSLAECGVEVVRDASGGRDLRGVLLRLFEREVRSVLVEGGAQVAGSFLDARLVDKVSFFVAPLLIGGRDAPTAVGGTGAEKLADAVHLTDVEVVSHGRDIEVTGYPLRDD